MSLFRPGISINWEWFDHKFSALCVTVNAPTIHWGHIWNRIAQTTFEGSLGHVLHCVNSWNINASEATLKDHLLNWQPMQQHEDIDCHKFTTLHKRWEEQFCEFLMSRHRSLLSNYFNTQTEIFKWRQRCQVLIEWAVTNTCCPSVVGEEIPWLFKKNSCL